MKAIQFIFTTIILVVTLNTATAQSGVQDVEVAMSYEDAAALLLEGIDETANESIAVASLGDQIRQARTAKNVSLETLAKAIGISKVNIENIEGNMVYPTRDIISKIEKHLSCEIILDPRMF